MSGLYEAASGSKPKSSYAKAPQVISLSGKCFSSFFFSSSESLLKYKVGCSFMVSDDSEKCFANVFVSGQSLITVPILFLANSFAIDLVKFIPERRHYYGIKIRMKGNRLSHSQSFEESYMRIYGCFEAPPVGLFIFSN